MDQFRTEVNIPEFGFTIHHSSHVVLMGSCFAENMGERLRQCKIKTTINPFGILFNPFSVMNSLERMLNDRPYASNELLQHNGNWVSLDHHGRFNHSNLEQAIEGINSSLEEGKKALLEADVIFITLGSAWVYEHIDSGKIVANCHKIPNKTFRKRLLSVQETHLILRHIPAFFKAKKLSCKVVFTVSPVRHWKDGAIENQRSKAHLLAAIHATIDEFDSCVYFPSYELLMDDLRDYRFYATDMLHPSASAIDYVWQKFEQGFFTDETRIICHELKAVIQAAQHRPSDPESNSFQRFLYKQLEIINALEAKYPALDLSSEKKHFSAYLI